MEYAVRIEKLSKRYHTWAGSSLGSKSLKEDLSKSFFRAVGIRSAKKHQTFWALKDINLEINKGEIIGIVGRNGAGKTTLLKIISGVTYPTTGNITIRGNLTSLLGIGLGFNTELSGRENIFLNGTILGMSMKEIKNKIDPIAEFAELGRFLQMPMKFYSSGMMSRLAFSVVAHLEHTETYIIDEALAAGDSAFQEKCIKKMYSIVKSGKTVLYVGHDMKVMRELTQRCLYLRNGEMVRFGDTASTVAAYIEHMHEEELRYRI